MKPIDVASLSAGQAIPLYSNGMRIGLLGGSFNPPHAAHRAISLFAIKRLKLDRVWWLLTPVIAPASGMLSGLLGRRSPGAGSLAAFDGIGGLPDDLISALETRAIWAKFGF